MVTLRLIFVSALSISLVSRITPAHACPTIDGVIDYNCDGRLKIVVTGDSIVRGVGDGEYANKGGYVARLKKDLRHAIIVNMGFPGYTTGALLQSFTANLNKKVRGRTKKLLTNADLIIIDVGRNDFWRRQSPGLTVRNIVRLAKLLRQKVGRTLRSPPFITIAYLLPTKRAFQKAFIDGVNDTLSSLNPSLYHVDLAFNELDELLLSDDGVHPSSEGYSIMEDMLLSYILNRLQAEQRALRPDDDKDGIFDKFEKRRFKTNPLNPDTDGDGVNDGDELFTYGTNPLDPLSVPAA